MPAQTIATYLAQWKLPACPTEKLAYLAGFFDGEGCIQLVQTPARKRSRNPEGGVGLTVVVVNTDQVPLELAQRYFAGTIRKKKMSQCGRTQPYYWMLHGKKAAYFLSQIRDHLTTKQQQADAVLLFAETYFSAWRHCEQPGWPLTSEAIQLRRLSFFAFRQAMNAKTGRGISWTI